MYARKPTIEQTLELTLKITVLTTFVILTLVLSAPLMAETRSSAKSIGFSASASLDKAEKESQLQYAVIEEMPVFVTQGFREESNINTVVVKQARYTAQEIILFDASTELISDFNYDGYYHRFNVSIDADTIFDSAYIYAKLYLSYEGGPWNHYATSESFHIYGDSENDLFIVETELADGFAPGYYDIRIELYDGDYHTRILSYGPYDDVSLSALPLEDSFYDDISPAIAAIETEVIITGQAHGSMGWWLIGLPVMFTLLRRLGNSNTTSDKRMKPHLMFIDT